MSDFIDRDLLLQFLKKADIPVTRSEREIIMAMPTIDDSELDRREHYRKVRMLVKKTHDRNRAQFGIFEGTETIKEDGYISID